MEAVQTMTLTKRTAAAVGLSVTMDRLARRVPAHALMAILLPFAVTVALITKPKIPTVAAVAHSALAIQRAKRASARALTAARPPAAVVFALIMILIMTTVAHAITNVTPIAVLAAPTEPASASTEIALLDVLGLVLTTRRIRITMVTAEPPVAKMKSVTRVSVLAQQLLKW